MKYANTYTIDGVEVVGTVLPLDMVPYFDPENPPQDNTYGVPDDVQVGWVKGAGGAWLPPPYKPPIPSSVSRFQARAALYQAGLLESVDAVMKDPATDFLARLAWEDASEFYRSSPYVTTIGAGLGLSSEQLDDLFRFAATIKA